MGKGHKIGRGKRGKVKGGKEDSKEENDDGMRERREKENEGMKKEDDPGRKENIKKWKGRGNGGERGTVKGGREDRNEEEED